MTAIALMNSSLSKPGSVLQFGEEVVRLAERHRRRAAVEVGQDEERVVVAGVGRGGHQRHLGQSVGASGVGLGRAVRFEQILDLAAERLQDGGIAVREG